MIEKNKKNSEINFNNNIRKQSNIDEEVNMNKINIEIYYDNKNDYIITEKKDIYGKNKNENENEIYNKKYNENENDNIKEYQNEKENVREGERENENEREGEREIEREREREREREIKRDKLKVEEEIRLIERQMMMDSMDPVAKR